MGAKSVQDPSTFVHIPFRQTKLMLVMKDAFELESHKLSRTVVFACVAPTLLDQAMTLNTLRYIGPIKQGNHKRKKVEANPRNPSNWDKFGKVNLVGLQEVEVEGKDQFLEVCNKAALARSTSTTMKNDQSSRSHAVVRVRIENTKIS